MSADVEVRIAWAGEGTRFHGGAPGGPQAELDGDGAAAPSPMQTLLLSLVGCTAADMVEILEKMRVGVRELRVHAEGDRAEEPPRRYTRLRLTYHASGVRAEDEAKVRRAVDLSQETYCSVMHSLRKDIDVVTNVEFG